MRVDGFARTVAGQVLVMVGWLLAAGAQAQATAPAPVTMPPGSLLQACAACHGAGGQSTDPLMPSIAGQPRIFLETQLVLIREGLRDVPTMAGVMKGLGDDAVVALASYFAAQPLRAAGAASRLEPWQRGRAHSQQRLCGTCHLADYSGQQQVPRLAGQQEAYLVRSMKQFRDGPGPGRDTVMAATLAGLADSDLADLAHYLRHEPPAAQTR